MKLEQAVSSHEHELCFLLNHENEAEKALLEMVDFKKSYFCWHDGRIALRTKFELIREVNKSC